MRNMHRYYLLPSAIWIITSLFRRCRSPNYGSLGANFEMLVSELFSYEEAV